MYEYVCTTRLPMSRLTPPPPLARSSSSQFLRPIPILDFDSRQRGIPDALPNCTVPEKRTFSRSCTLQALMLSNPGASLKADISFARCLPQTLTASKRESKIQDQEHT